MEGLINSYIGKYIHLSLGSPNSSDVSFALNGKLLGFDERTERYMVGCSLSPKSSILASANFKLSRVVGAEADGNDEMLRIKVK